jgi:hypothetical protein
MDLTKLLDDDSQSQRETKIRNHVKENGFYIDYDYQEICGLEHHSLKIPVHLRADSGNKCNNEIDKDAYASCYKNYPDHFDGYMPEIRKNVFTRTHDWYAINDPVLYSKGYIELFIWYRYYDKPYGLGFDLDEKRDVFFVKIDNSQYKYYIPIGEVSSEIVGDFSEEDIGVWICQEDVSQKNTLIVSGRIFEYKEDLEIDHSKIIPL